MIGSALSRISMADKLSVSQLQQAIKDGTVPAYVGVPLLQEKIRQSQQARALAGAPTGQPPIAQQVMQEAEGLTSAQSNLPEFTAFDGGIVAFADGDLVDDEEDDDDAEEAKFDKELLAENEALAAQLLGNRGSVDYSLLGTPPSPAAMGSREGSGLIAITKPDTEIPRKPAPPAAAAVPAAAVMAASKPEAAPVTKTAPTPVVKAAPATAAKPESSQGLAAIAPTEGVTIASTKETQKTGLKVPKGHKYEATIIKEAKRLGVDPRIATKLAMLETGGHETPETAVSSAGAQGIMQLMPGTAKEMKVADVTNPEQNIRGGLAYFKRMLDKYKDPKIAGAAYNWGPGNVDRWLKTGADPKKLPAETRKYIKSLATGGTIKSFKKGGDEGEDDDSVIDYAPYALAAPDIARMGLRGLRAAPSIPWGAVGSGAGNVAGNVVKSYAAPGVTSLIGVPGYYASKFSTGVMGSPTAEPLRKGLTQNYLLGATAPDAAIAAGIIEQATPEARSQSLAEAESLKDAPWYTRMYGIGRTEWLKQHPPKEKPVITEEGKALPRGKDIEKAEAAIAEQTRAIEEGRGPHAVAAAERAKTEEALKTEAEAETKAPSMQDRLEAMLAKREEALGKQREEDKYMSILAAGLGMMSGTSPHALTNIGAGAMKGVETAAALSKLRAAEEKGLTDARMRQYAVQQNEALRKAAAASSNEVKIGQMIGYREKQLENKAQNDVLKTGIVLDSAEGMAAISKRLAELRSADPYLAKLYKDFGLPAIEASAMAPAAVDYGKKYGLTPKK